MLFLYSFFIALLTLALRLAAFFHPKARLWVAGRRHWRQRYATIRSTQPPKPKTLWMHVASLGEFEQGRPVIEAFRAQFPHWQIVLSFFSPSGYEVRKNYAHADFVCYLPADTRRNARDFLDLIQPDAVIFVKYEFWAHYLFELKRRGTPALLVSALFRESQPFFQGYGRLWRQMLDTFTHVFVQDKASASLLQRIGFQRFTVAGDNRVDRVLQIAQGAAENDIVRTFVGEAPFVFIAGSCWAADEAIFLPLLRSDGARLPEPMAKCILAPHEPTEENVARICRQAGSALRYSQGLSSALADARCLVIDNIGLLNTLYRYGTVAYIGGGFGKGIHNTLEPAAWGLPVIFGPKYQKFAEARQLVARGGAFSVKNGAELAAILQRLQEPIFYEKAARAALALLEESKGATEQVILFLKRLFPAG